MVSELVICLKGVFCRGQLRTEEERGKKAHHNPYVHICSHISWHSYIASIAFILIWLADEGQMPNATLWSIMHVMCNPMPASSMHPSWCISVWLWKHVGAWLFCFIPTEKCRIMQSSMPIGALFVSKVDEETKITTFVIQLKRFSLMIAQLHKWTIGQLDLFAESTNSIWAFSWSEGNF